MITKKISTSHRHFFDTFFLFLESDLVDFSVPVQVGFLQHAEIMYRQLQLDEDEDDSTTLTPFILFNTEQLSRKTELMRLICDIKQTSPLEVWDYSHTNCLILKEHGIIAKHVPLLIPDHFINFYKSVRDIGITHDIGFSGSVNQRREFILKNLQQNGFSVNIINKWGEERDRELARCKIHLNIHYTEEYQIFESARCNPWLALGVVVISETSLDNDPRCINVPYDKIIETVTNFLKNNE